MARCRILNRFRFPKLEFDDHLFQRALTSNKKMEEASLNVNNSGRDSIGAHLQQGASLPFWETCFIHVDLCQIYTLDLSGCDRRDL